ncbi:MAG: deoxyribonuclease IV [Gemmatimonadota bacterium]|jgi:deoxyribonuclease-4|nr:deoxyribonuclease IV [Gemmatimonadota bacterium]MDP6461512.1 deoxyribonuclease IV [Gemmatimonadota bacterium]MDP6528736.1 deoxyribonuclease IV [Gemmatimonadota bacterium]MDP6802235.1 deoxyribonuclease IV [Gemmatimonadota bacterium]MDP7032156.1 deoxyribonuclease IV [Gemmatimonadota bacterium]
MLLGAHMSVAGGAPTAFARAESVGCTALQIFVKNANRWKGRPLGDEEVRDFAAERARSGILPVFAHASYLINLGSPDSALWERSIRALVDELERCERLKLNGLVVHPGAHVGSGEEAGLLRIARGLDRVIAATEGFACPVLLETTAGQGSTLGWRFEHLASIREGVSDPARIAFCFDTCHSFTAGYDLRDEESVREALAEFDRVCGLDSLRAIHANDSLKPFASRRDRHAHIGCGEIGNAGFAALLRAPELQSVPFLLETPKGSELLEDARNLEVLRALARGENPDPGPPPSTPEWAKGVLA